jgi:peptide/nickel transport system substrate-binding protein
LTITRSMRRGLTAVAVVAAGALALSGCTTSAPDDGGTSGGGEGGTITIAQTNEITSLNSNTPQSNLDINGMVGYISGGGSAGGPGAFMYLDDEYNIVHNDAIGTYEKTSDDPLTVKYTINADQKWSDGEPITADDMVYAWAASSGYYDSATTDDEGTVTAGTQYFTIAGSTEGINSTEFPEVGDDNMSVTLTYDQPYVDWELVNLIDKPAHVAADKAGVSVADLTSTFKDTPRGDPAAPTEPNATIKAVADFYNTGYDITSMPTDESLLVASGPFVLSAWEPTQSATFKKNPEYTGDLTPKFDTLVIRFIGDTNAQVTALQNGEVDAIQPQASADTLTALEANNADVIQGDQLAYDHIDLNFGSATFADKNVREAFLKTIPRQQILDAIVTPVNPDASVLNSQIFVPAEPEYDDSVADNGSSAYEDVDIDGAKALLNGATPTVNILYNSENPNRVDAFAAIQASAAQAGFDVTDGGSPDWSSLLDGGDYDASIFGWVSPGAGSTVLPQLFSINGGGNYNKYSNAEADKLALESQVTTDPDQLADIKKQIDKLTFDDAYGLPLFQSPGLFASNGTVDGLQHFGGQTGILWNVWEWTKSE